MANVEITKTKNQELLNIVEANYLKLDNPKIRVGDSVKLGIRITEGQKTRVQFYEGIIISKKNSALNQTITVRRIFQGIGIERCFLIHSPKIESITILRSSKVRRSKLYYLRKLSGKATRLKQRFN
jgi:large subunit ribosomal protein L19|tara:strand:- start:918 stop:1295 length:378 start_codon:yes stop_codon:yes gene_type:complete